MITKEKIVFLATESTAHERELVYQEYFSKQKTEYALPEIVAQMEKAQDVVIRANHRGPMLISGPAGSGKTTLALHRVAYLAQSPDVSDKFSPTSIIVFVQDEGTRDYFSHLLPELGIKGVTITTFASWAMKVLDLSGFKYVDRIGEIEKEKDLFESKKREAIKNVESSAEGSHPFAILEQVYAKTFSNEQTAMFVGQKQKKQLDRFDLTALLLLHKKTHKRLTLMQDYYQMDKVGAGATKGVGRFPVTYSLMIFDEFQNYLPEQIRLAKSTLDEEHNAVMYVGDMAQQTKLGTIRKWSDASEQITEERSVMLHKVYRNTKHILQYIQSVGYDIEIIDGLKQGVPVEEKVCSTIEEQVAHVKNLLESYTGTVGILAKDKETTDVFAALKSERVQVMTMHEAQGVEFGLVCIVGITKELFGIEYKKDFPALAEEKKKMNEDLLYVALTRAIDELHVLGECTLGEAIDKN